MIDRKVLDTIISGLNEAQRAAVTCQNDTLQVLAPPGSGKTKTLTSRVAYLIASGYKPWNIIVATFTVKAAREMKDRVGSMLGNGLESKVILGTFHSICFRYLVRYGSLIGLKKGFGIADTADSLNIIKRIAKVVLENKREKGYDARGWISSAKSRRLDPQQWRQTLKPGADNDKKAEIYQQYEDALDKANLLDYDDLLLRFAELLEQHPNVVSNIEAVLVDEFQDTNSIQYELMNLMASAQERVTIVGDPDQSIYGFRNADIGNLGKMTQLYQGCAIVNLKENYRSCGSILMAAMDVIEQDKGRPQKGMTPVHCVGTPPVLRSCKSNKTEADFIVKEIRKIRQKTNALLKFEDISILLRSGYLSRVIESALGRSGIPYRMVGTAKFYERVEIRLVLDYLCVITNVDNSEAVLRVINEPPRRVGKSSLKTLESLIDSEKSNLWTIIKQGAKGRYTEIKSWKGLEAFVAIIERCQSYLFKHTPTIVEMIEYVMEQVQLEDYLADKYSTDETFESRMDNIEELKLQANEFTDTFNPADDDLPEIKGLKQEQSTHVEYLSKFLASVCLSSKAESVGKDTGMGLVTISTIHSAKGLEWPVVFVPAIYEGSIPHYRAENTDEERRLLYVAMTRAKVLLYMSYPESNDRDPYLSISKFLDHSSIKRYVQKQATLKYSNVKDMARTLGRDCPPEPSADLIDVSDDDDADQGTSDRKRKFNSYASNLQRDISINSGAQYGFRTASSALLGGPSSTVTGSSHLFPEGSAMSALSGWSSSVGAMLNARSLNESVAKIENKPPQYGYPLKREPFDPMFKDHRIQTKPSIARPPKAEPVDQKVPRGGEHGALFSSSPPPPIFFPKSEATTLSLVDPIMLPLSPKRSNCKKSQKKSEEEAEKGSSITNPITLLSSPKQEQPRPQLFKEAQSERLITRQGTRSLGVRPGAATRTAAKRGATKMAGFKPPSRTTKTEAKY